MQIRSLKVLSGGYALAQSFAPHTFESIVLCYNDVLCMLNMAGQGCLWCAGALGVCVGSVQAVACQLPAGIVVISRCRFY
jgi:hypothetical protein